MLSSRYRRFLPMRLALAALACLPLQATLLSRGRTLAQGRPMPPPPMAPVKIYNPDADTCRADPLLRSYRNQLQQFADQPPAVIQRLRLMQLAMGEASLKQCASDGRLSREEADRIWRELQSMPMPGSQPP